MRRSASSGSSSAATPASPRQPGPLRGLDDQPRQPLAPAAVEPVGLRVFVDQPLELAARRRTRPASTSGGGRWPMVTAAMRRLACAASPGIADDEGIDRPAARRRRASGKQDARQRHGLARQPFQRAVRAHMDERIGLGDVPQPQPEGEQRMARRQGRVVIVGAAVARTPAVGRQAPPARCRTRARGTGTHRRARRRRPRARPRRRASAAIASAGRRGQQPR